MEVSLAVSNRLASLFYLIFFFLSSMFNLFSFGMLCQVGCFLLAATSSAQIMKRVCFEGSENIFGWLFQVTFFKNFLCFREYHIATQCVKESKCRRGSSIFSLCTEGLKAACGENFHLIYFVKPCLDQFAEDVLRGGFVFILFLRAFHFCTVSYSQFGFVCLQIICRIFWLIFEIGRSRNFFVFKCVSFIF